MITEILMFEFMALSRACANYRFRTVQSTMHNNAKQRLFYIREYIICVGSIVRFLHGVDGHSLNVHSPPWTLDL